MSDATKLVFPRFVTLERAAVVGGTDGTHFVQTHHHQSRTPSPRLIVSLGTRQQTLRSYEDGLHNFRKQNWSLELKMRQGGKAVCIKLHCIISPRRQHKNVQSRVSYALYRVIFLQNCEELLGDVVVTEGVLHRKVELVPTNVPERSSIQYRMKYCSYNC